jgi:hypothetical protein
LQKTFEFIPVKNSRYTHCSVFNAHKSHKKAIKTIAVQNIIISIILILQYLDNNAITTNNLIDEYFPNVPEKRKNNNPIIKTIKVNKISSYFSDIFLLFGKT